MSSPSAEDKQRAAQILMELKQLYPNARCALNFTSALELLVATMLAAQCTDERVDQVEQMRGAGAPSFSYVLLVP